MSLSHTGIKFTEEHKKNMSIANQKETAGFHGHRHTEESKKLQSIATSIRNATEEWKINNKLKLSKLVVQFSKNMDIICIWNSIKTAGESLNLQRPSISRCCRNERLSTGGYKWKYVYDQISKDGTKILGAISLGLITEEQISELITRD